jgi:hypothetical protein
MHFRILGPLEIDAESAFAPGADEVLGSRAPFIPCG